MSLSIAMVLLSAVILVIITIILLLLNASKEERYEQDIIFIEMCIKNWTVTKNNYYVITEMFERIWRNNQNPERTNKAYSRFKNKYQEFYPKYVIKELVNQN